MIIPDIQRGGFKRVAEFRYFNCKKNRYTMTYDKIFKKSIRAI